MLDKIDVLILNVLTLLFFIGVVLMQIGEAQTFFGSIGPLFAK